MMLVDVRWYSFPNNSLVRVHSDYNKETRGTIEIIIFGGPLSLTALNFTSRPKEPGKLRNDRVLSRSFLTTPLTDRQYVSVVRLKEWLPVN